MPLPGRHYSDPSRRRHYTEGFIRKRLSVLADRGSDRLMEIRDELARRLSPEEAEKLYRRNMFATISLARRFVDSALIQIYDCQTKPNLVILFVGPYAYYYSSAASILANAYEVGGGRIYSADIDIKNAKNARALSKLRELLQQIRKEARGRNVIKVIYDKRISGKTIEKLAEEFMKFGFTPVFDHTPLLHLPFYSSDGKEMPPPRPYSKKSRYLQNLAGLLMDAVQVECYKHIREYGLYDK